MKNCSQNVFQLKIFPSKMGTSIMGNLTPLLTLLSELIVLSLSLVLLVCNSLQSSSEQSNNAFSTVVTLTFSSSSFSRSKFINAFLISDKSIVWPLIPSSFSCRRQISSDAAPSEFEILDTLLLTQASRRETTLCSPLLADGEWAVINC